MPEEVWQNVIVERFLIRLCLSPYHSHFILKGGSLLAKHINIGRETTDIDFAIQRIGNEVAKLREIFIEITNIVVDDGFIFSNPLVTPLDHFHMQYPGARVKIEVHFGKSRFPLFVDLGFGDKVTAQEKEITLLSSSKGPLFEKSVTVSCYPIEFIFAEKLETTIHRGSENSRMKDYHDLFSLVSSGKILDEGKVEDAIRSVFSHRKTPIALPIRFSDEATDELQKYWDRYRHSTTSPEALPDHIKQLIEQINRWLALNTTFQ